MHLKEVDANLLVTLDALLVDASVTRAAERLGRSASAISHALAKLRELFDDELFVRAGQRLVPTARALELAPTVHVILAGMESLLRPNKPFDPSLTMRGFAAASSEAGELILIEPLRKRLHEAAPSVRVDWTPSHAESTIDDLRNARCHFVIDIAGESAERPTSARPSSSTIRSRPWRGPVTRISSGSPAPRRSPPPSTSPCTPSPASVRSRAVRGEPAGPCARHLRCPPRLSASSPR
ncbi:hypothetical protein AUC68_01935 [Methyloceanibacter methanicus]|uniref:HTH lysR-type domain-containing protein n=1 Tax=Methyloceanibacter methanicus TaxID=1774968 RepID=A0A1E3W261_9HYPH|nr:hypothetical protein AUC68_01935 [Methyloceanibacter methanicus]